MTVRVLSMHAAYRCRQSGVCCISNWPIPVEADRLGQLRAAIASGRLRPRATPWNRQAAAGDEEPAAVLDMDSEGCAFYSPADRRCEIHRALGHERLPLACRQFPRVSVHDPRGTSITLSHYCPTAAHLLEFDAPVTIAEDPPAFPPTGEYVGLDARDALPPLLGPDLLMDWPSWWECERLAVELLGNFRGSPRDALARLAGAVQTIQSWTPSDGAPLIEHVRASFARATPAPGRLAIPSDLIGEALSAIPADLRPPRLPPPLPRPADAIVNRFLAAHTFANWTVHGRQGLDGWQRSIETALALIDAGLGVRGADLWLRHLSHS